MAVGAVIGTVSGVLLDPGAAAWVVAAGAVQLAATAFVGRAVGRPTVFASVVANTCLTTTLADPVLVQLAARRAAPWAPLAITTAAQVLLRSSRDRGALAAGAGALVAATAAPAAVNLRAGAPPAAAVLAAAVPLLAGALIAVARRLGEARGDRLHRGPRPSSAAPSIGSGVHPHLPVVILRLDQLAASAPDPRTRGAAADLAGLVREVATGGRTEDTIRVEILPRTTAAHTARPPAVPELGDREREILALVATGATNAAIGRDLSEATVKQYVSRLMRRFGDDNRTQLALRAAPWFPAGTTAPPEDQASPGRASA